MRTRRAPWLSGLLTALVMIAWMAGQIIGGVIGMVGQGMSLQPSGPPTAPAFIDSPPPR